MSKDSQLGIWCRKDGVFYYLETGDHIIHNELERLKTSLLARELITFSQSRVVSGEETHKVMKRSEAKEKKYEIKPIYVTNHVKKTIEERDLAKDSNPWQED